MTATPASRASAGPWKSTGSPSTSTRPVSGRWTPPSIRTIVDLPAPFSPASARTSPERSAMSTPRAARTAPYDLLASSSARIGGSAINSLSLQGQPKRIKTEHNRSCQVAASPTSEHDFLCVVLASGRDGWLAVVERPNREDDRDRTQTSRERTPPRRDAAPRDRGAGAHRRL